MKRLTALLVLLFVPVASTEALSIEKNTLAERSLPLYIPSAPRRGLPYTNAKWTENFHTPDKIVWAYNWNSNIDPVLPPSLEFVPMLFSGGAAHTSIWSNNVEIALKRGTTHLLAFNEPDYCGKGGACMKPQAAVDTYRTYINKYAGRAYLGAPAVTNGPSGLPWLTEFLKLCTDCHIDFVPLHWYDKANNFGYLKWYVGKVKAVAGPRNLWITEFNGSGSGSDAQKEAQQEAFLTQALPWLDAQVYVSRYAWFYCDPNFKGGAIVDAQGNPTKLGKVYAYTGS